MTQTHSRKTALPPDIHRELFSSFFESEEFLAWKKAESRWQLRLIGGPGTGKTTLAHLVLDELEKQGDAMPVAAIFMRYGCLLPAGEVIADVLGSIRKQLLPESSQSEDIASNEETLDRNRQSLKTVLTQVRHTFLVIDGLDHCGHEAWSRLEGELSKLKNDGLSILVTSRVPFRRNTTEYECDRCPEKRPIKIYWQCHRCREENYSVCGNCKIDGDVCPQHGSVLFEPYERIYVDMDGEIVTDAAMEGYIQWDLEREHGDLGLESSNDFKPPASSLCKALARNKNSNAAQELVTYIAEKAERDITQARLRLDLVREAETVNETQHTIERLPKSVIAVFKAGIKSVREQEEPSRTLGLNAICLVTDGDVSEGIETGMFMERLQALCSPNWDRTAKSDFLDEIIYASKGLLSVWLGEDGKERVVAYHHDFFFYVGEDYDELLSAVRRNIKLD